MRFIAFTWGANHEPIRKGVVEVVRTEPKVSVARIIATQSDQAIGKGDLVYNLAGPKPKLFVFVGEPQLYTLAQWTNIIRANGGEVVAQVEKGGQVADYLVYAHYDEQNAEANAAIKEARDFGVKMLSEDALKDLMALK